MPGNNNTLKYRVEQLEKSYDALDEKIDKILTNDLPHLSSELKAIKTEVRVFAVLNVVAIVGGIIISKLFL